MDKFKSKLIFKKYIVDEVNFNYNDRFVDKSVTIDFDIEKEVTYISEREMQVRLIVYLFKNTEKEYPFKMKVAIRGFFEIENNDDNINFEPNAIAILYPYIRSIVSTYTSTANVMPLILPVINVNKMLQDKEMKD